MLTKTENKSIIKPIKSWCTILLYNNVYPEIDYQSCRFYRYFGKDVIYNESSK